MCISPIVPYKTPTFSLLCTTYTAGYSNSIILANFMPCSYYYTRPSSVTRPGRSISVCWRGLCYSIIKVHRTMASVHNICVAFSSVHLWRLVFGAFSSDNVGQGANIHLSKCVTVSAFLSVCCAFLYCDYSIAPITQNVKTNTYSFCD